MSHHHNTSELSLVVGISHPRECTHGTNDNSDIGDCPNDEDRVRVLGMVSEIVHDLKDKPASTGQRTSAVDAS